ncbi:MAG: zinc-binding dehydrogenase, partial [bacterium]
SCFDPLGNATHTALSFDLLGEDVLITGAGPIGLMATAIARHCAARHVVVTDVQPYRLELARKMGATVALDVSKDVPLTEVLKTLGMKEGFDVGLEMSGNPAAFRGMIDNMCHGGKIALLGILPQTEIDWNKVVFNSLTIKGIYGREMYETWYKMTMMIQCGLDITPAITHRFHYTEFHAAFETMRSGNSGKIVLDWSPLP